MAQRHRTENASLVDATPSYPNTPLSGSNTWRQYLHYRPSPCGQAVSPPPAPGPSSAAVTTGEVQRSGVSCAASADTTQWQSGPACLPASSSPAENEFSCAAAPPSHKSSASTLRRRCPSLIELLLASTCLSCDAASREALQQHVRGKRIKRIIEHLTETVRVSVGSQAALAFPGSQQLPLVAAVAGICSPEQQCRLLRGAYNDDCLPEFPTVSDDVYKSSTTSLPSSGPSACQARRASPSATRSYPAVFPVLQPPCRADASDDSFYAHADRSLAAAAAATVKREAIPSPSRVVRLSATAGEAERTSLAAEPCATTQRHLPVQHIQISRNADGVAEIVLQFDSPLRRRSQNRREDSTADILALAAERPLRALADSGGCGEAFPPHGERDDSSEGRRTAGVGGEEVAFAATQRDAERTDRTAPGEGRGGSEGESPLRGAGSVSDEGLVPASASSIARRRRPLLPSTESARKLDACAVATAVPTDGRSATTQEEGGQREEEGLVSRGGDRVGRTSAEGTCLGTSAATAAPPVARLTLQQLKGVVSAAQLYCSTVGKHLQCFRENMERVQRLSLLETFRQVSGKSTSTEACTPSGDGDGIRSGEDKHSGSSGGADRGRSDTRSSTGGDVSSSSSRAVFGSGRGGSGTERADSLGVVLAGTSDRGSLSVVDSASATCTPSSTVQHDETTLLSVLQQLRLPRDQNLTAAEVLGVRTAEDSTTATTEDASECIAGSETASARSDAAGTMPTPAGPAETTEVKQRKAGGPKEDGGKERELCSPSAAGEPEPKGAFSASAPDDRTSADAEAAEAETDLRHARHGKDSRSQQQQRLIVSLADLRDLSVLERSREGTVATLRWQQHALRKRALWREKVEEAMNSVAAAAGGASGERRATEVRGNSTESSVILLERSEATGDADTWAEGKMELDLSLRKRRKALGDAAEEGAGRSGSAAADRSPSTTRGKGTGEAAVEGTPYRKSAAKPTEEEVGLIAGASELEALCEAVERESVKLLELVTFYENFSAECLRYATQDRGYLDDENTRNG